MFYWDMPLPQLDPSPPLDHGHRGVGTGETVPQFAILVGRPPEIALFSIFSIYHFLFSNVLELK